MKRVTKLIAVVLALMASVAFAAEGEIAKKVDEKPWTYKTQKLGRAELDKLLEHPEKVLFIDVRRPDEVSKNGSFPVYLSVQSKAVAAALPYIPKDRLIVTVSNRAHRAGDVADQLASLGYQVAGAAGTKDYEEQGGTIARIAIPEPAVASAK